MKRTLTIAAGGTGGHVFPAAAFAAEMKTRGWRITLVTDWRGARYTEEFPATEIMHIRAGRLSLRAPWRSTIAAIRIMESTARCAAHIRTRHVRLVAGFGGYAAFPCLAAAWLTRAPILIHEQNTVLGRVNRVFANRARVVASGFARLDRLPQRAAARHVVTGNPVRAQLAERLQTCSYPPESDRITILVIGGSQGAARLGEIVPEAIAGLPPEMRARIDVVQQTRSEQIAFAHERYRQAGVGADLAPFFDDMTALLRRADLVIARAGASTLAELALAGRPAILFPLPSAADNHQRINAETFANAGAADLLAESADDCTDQLSALLLARIGKDSELRSRSLAARGLAYPDAARDLADRAEGILG